MPDEPIDEGQETGRPGEISRRRMLKRAGAAAAIAWATPVVTTLRTPAFAQNVSPGACPPWECGQTIVECGDPATCINDLCVCDSDVDGNPVCWQDFSCGDTITCSSNADCVGLGSGDWKCTSNCCGVTCTPPCGECAPGFVGGLAESVGATAAGTTNRGGTAAGV